MLDTVEDVVRALVDCYQPDRVVLFGSHARGTARPDSDIDLLVVKDTAASPRERRAEVDRLLLDRRVPLDVCVYTPVELTRLYRLGSPFIEAVLATGRVVYMRKATEAWMAEVHEEIRTARLLFEHQILRGACLHSQQAVEKGLKALLLERGDHPPRTHDLVDLRNRVTALGWPLRLSTDDLVFLNSVYRGRYPTDEGLLPRGEPTTEEARQAVEASERFAREVAVMLGSEGTPPD